ncbi:Hypothetical protein SCLAV_4689 [Streptomyces clavuligerus]|uniref:Uncharacterized protein n=1 Tax=Streptomyces clavuligerus TaxID=1901 RepID=E2QA62_STRCL|nr:Hypothetical protein SCLAV_4689 [Streptomyces clavuligerus]
MAPASVRRPTPWATTGFPSWFPADSDSGPDGPPRAPRTVSVRFPGAGSGRSGRAPERRPGPVHAPGRFASAHLGGVSGPSPPEGPESPGEPGAAGNPHRATAGPSPEPPPNHGRAAGPRTTAPPPRPRSRAPAPDGAARTAPRTARDHRPAPGSPRRSALRLRTAAGARHHTRESVNALCRPCEQTVPTVRARGVRVPPRNGTPAAMAGFRQRDPGGPGKPSGQETGAPARRPGAATPAAPRRSRASPRAACPPLPPRPPRRRSHRWCPRHRPPARSSRRPARSRPANAPRTTVRRAPCHGRSSAARCRGRRRRWWRRRSPACPGPAAARPPRRCAAPAR